MMKVLGIETSCDETGVAIYDGEHGLLIHDVYTQSAMHEVHGGVVPELASRDHIKRLAAITKSLLRNAKLSPQLLSGIAYTAGPGLIGALLVGASFARSMAWSLNIPAVAIHHMEGHLLAPMLESPAPSFPFLALLVSGGHTQLVSVKSLGDYEIIGDTLDDAVGEAFDKTAKLLGLGYPGGAALANLAKQGDPQRFQFSRPMTDRPGLDFSFSGLKTQVLKTYRQFAIINENLKADIASAFQLAVIETLVIKCKRALLHYPSKQLVVAGGVSANHLLREKLAQLMNKLGGQVFFPRPEFSTDNGAMIAYAGYLRLKQGRQDDLQIKAHARWDMQTI
jgi:N6-L-threonylcarbamoyladenine synthase